MEMKFKRQIASLDEVFNFLDESLSGINADPAAAYVLQLAVEEFFTNMVKYSKEGTNDITIIVDREDRTARVTLVDEGVEPFDVTKAGDVDTSRPLEERRVGGLGIYISKEMLDGIEYSYANRTSTIILRKKLET